MYTAGALTWTGLGLQGTSDWVTVALAWSLVAGVPLLFVLLWRARPRPGLEFALLLTLIALTYGLTHARGVESWRLSGVPVLMANLDASVVSLGLFVTPLLFRFGIDFAQFARKTAGWVTVFAAERFRPGFCQGCC